MCQAVHSHFYSDVSTKSIPSKAIRQLAFLHPVHTTTEKFENGIVTLKTHQMYSVHIKPEKFKKKCLYLPSPPSPGPFTKLNASSLGKYVLAPILHSFQIQDGDLIRECQELLKMYTRAFEIRLHCRLSVDRRPDLTSTFFRRSMDGAWKLHFWGIEEDANKNKKMHITQMA